MISFIFKKPSLVVDCFTANASVYEYARIQPAIKKIPGWFKQVPSTVRVENEYVKYLDKPTMRTCYGFKEYFRKSFVMPLWSDIVFDVSETHYGYQMEGGNEGVDYHPPEQTNFAFSNNFYHFKFATPWVISCKKDINFMLVDPFWYSTVNKEVCDNFFVHHGFVNFNYSTILNVNAFVRREKARFSLPFGHPLVQILPITEKNVLIKTHLLTEPEFRKQQIYPVTATLNRMRKTIAAKL